MLSIEDQNQRRDVTNFTALALSDASARCQTIELSLTRQISVEVSYLILRMTTRWTRRKRDRSMLIRIPCNRGGDDIHVLGHHMTGLLNLFCWGELTDHLDVLNFSCTCHINEESGRRVNALGIWNI